MAEDPYKYFRIEAAELVEQLSQGVFVLDQGSAVPENVARLFRQAHTLKGAARVVRLLDIADAAHRIEDLLAPYRDAEATVSSGHVRALLAEIDAIAAGLETLEKPQRQSSTAHAGEVSLQTVRAEVAVIDQVLEGLSEALSEVHSLDACVGDWQRVRELSELIVDQTKRATSRDREQAVATLGRTQSLCQELDLLVQRAGSGLSERLERARRELDQAHTIAERLRFVPVALAFTSLERAVRDAAVELGKAVRFEAVGDVRLDGAVLEIVQNALFHVVRNAVAHGIETQSERHGLGKPPGGTVRLEVRQSGRQVTFVCRDDGRGLDRQALGAALSRQGQDASKLTDEQLMQHLLRAGISTASGVTGVSGRGVGLDVLREAAERLGGQIRLDSQRGRGFSVELSVPLNQSTLEGLVVCSGSLEVALPTDAVVKSVRLRSEQITRTPQGDHILHEGAALPFATLPGLLGVAGTPIVRSAVILRVDEGACALGVERLLGIKTFVLRKLPELAVASPLVLGALVDALGIPKIVLDPRQVVLFSERHREPALPARPKCKPILVIDDSLTTRMLEQSILESAGYAVELATSGEEALEKALAKAYALFLVDVEMPGIDGFTFIERSRQHAQLRDVPAILVSSRSAADDLARGEAVGARGYVIKGQFDQREVLGLIAELVHP